MPGSAAPLAAGGGGGSGASAGGYDPFTGAARYVPASAGAAPAASTATTTHSFFPVRQFLRFDQANLDAISSESVSLTYPRSPKELVIVMDYQGLISSLLHLPTVFLWAFFGEVVLRFLPKNRISIR